ncbi:MAG: hypothetical protein CVT99_05835 [Bacteroidetes bacterium HGW-Bacteroidetes-16]|nr:MAG: hypothetical protein CVT99_05835 [Bacteroidetes bacterium HGW-Bacteroidetes-16]
MKTITFSKSIWLLLIMIMAIGSAQSQIVSDPSDALSYDANKAAQINEKTEIFNESRNDNMENIFSESTANNNRTGGCYISPDGSYGTFGRNDDGSLGPFNLPFGFDLYGTVYTQVWINNNGNITFIGPYSSFTASGFPFGLPMVAPFWGDVDTRGAGSGVVRYKINPTNMIVAWDHVGYYGAHYEKRNSFQLVISNANDPLIGIGNNVAFYYGDMQWTTGDASGGSGGFGGSPATVGINKGNNVDYVQIGRFGNPGSAYDGPGGATDGIDYLDNQCFTFNVSNAFNQPPAVSGVPSGNVVNLACGETQTISLSFIGPEVAQTVTTTINTGGLCNTTTNITNGSVSVASVTITAGACNQGSHVISFTATDNYSVPASTTVDITVNVATCCVPPTITCPTQVVAVNDAGQCGAIVNYSNATTTGSPAPTVSYSQPSGSYFPVGTTEVTVTAENSCGISTCTFNVTVNDGEAPVALTQDITIQLDASGQANISAGDINNGSSDNCGIQDLLLMEGDGLVYGEVPEGYNLTLTAPSGKVFTEVLFASYGTPTGSAGNYAYGWCHANNSQAIVENYSLGNNTFTIPAVNGLFGDPCGGTYKRLYVLAAYDNTAQTIAYSCSDVGEHTETLTVVDVHGNASSATAVVTVVDVMPPVVSTQPVTVNLDEFGMASITAEQVDNNSSDNCGVASISVFPAQFDCSQVGEQIVTLTVIDNNNNEASATAVVTVVDAMLPVVSTQPVTVNLDEFGMASITAEQVDNNSSDNCSVASISVFPAQFDCSQVGEQIVTLTVIDNNNNEASATAVVTVVDAMLPVVSTQPVTVNLNEFGMASITAEQVDNNSSDNCGVTSISVFPVQFDCNQVGEQIVTLTVIDNNNNEASATALVTVVDNMAPEALCQTLTIALDETGSASITASQIDNGSNDNCGVASVTVFPMDFSCADLGENTVTLTVTDNNQNVSVCTSTVTVEDNILPVLTAIANPITLWPPNHKYETISMSQLFVSVWDNCGVLSIDDVYITSVTSDEVENANGNGDGNTVNDIVISSDCNSVDLRKERSGNGNGRVYTIYMSVDDGNGNTGTASCQVQVPHNNGGTAIDDGMAYEVTANCGFKNAAVPGGGDLPQIVGMNLYPNPTNEKATVEFTLTEANNTTVYVYNSMGMRIATLFDGMAVSDHRYELEFDGSSQSVGMYYVILQSGASIHEVKKMILNR